MTRGLCCVLQIVHDSEYAAAFYARAGFIVGPPRTLSNPLLQTQRDIQVPGFYLTLASPPRPPDHILALVDPASSPGLAAVYLDPEETPAPVSSNQLPGVGAVPVPEIVHTANAALQPHPNSVFAVAGVVVVAKDPSDHHIFLSALTGQRDLRATSAGVTARTGRGELSIVDPTAFRGLYGAEPPDIAKSARIAALRFSVRDREALLARLKIGAVPFLTHMGHVVIAPANAMGATLVFEGPGG